MLNQYCGPLNRIGALTGGGMITTNNGVGNVRVASEITVLEIGDKMLRQVRCTEDMYDLLDPNREACVFIFRHFFYKPVLLGVKYDDGRKYTITLAQTIASILSYILIFPLLAVVSGFMIGLMGGKEGGFIAGLGVTWIVVGVLGSWAQAALLLVSYVIMKAR